MPIELKIEQFVNVNPAEVYFAFTHASSLTEWMCDFATVVPRPGGRMYLWWHDDFYSAGEFLSLDDDKTIQFKWHARQDPGPSHVCVDLQAMHTGTQVRLTHALPDGEYWSEHAQGFKQKWTSTLANLAQVLETGLDKRLFDRPVLGINISDFNPEIAKAMNVPVGKGIRLDFLSEELGAYRAGLRKNDVIIALDGKVVTNDIDSLFKAIQGRKSGDKVEVGYFRGADKKSLVMELTKRPIPQISWKPTELAKVIRAKYDEGLAALEEAFLGVSEAEASWHPGPEQWNAKEVLAHLIQTERHWLENLADTLGGYVRISDDWAGNCNVHVQATVAAYGSVRSLLDEMKLLSNEMVAFVVALPPEFVARKASYFQAANMLLEGSLPHILSHISQIQAAIEGARKR